MARADPGQVPPEIEDMEEDVPEELVAIGVTLEETSQPQHAEDHAATVHKQATPKAVKITRWISEMKATREEMVRSVPADKVLHRCGVHLRSQRKRKAGQKAKLFARSNPSTSIDQFWSHSWHGKQWWKVLTLLFFKNGLPACCISTMVAAIMAILFAFELLPGWVKTSNYAPPEPHVYGAWGLWTGALAYFAVIILWKPRGNVFVDLFCIHQADAQLKAEGVLSLGAVLKKSKSMLVLWDETYLKRLWCVFELAAFLKSHQGDAVNGQLVIKPTIVGPAVFWNMIAMVLMMSSDLVFTSVPSVMRFVLVFLAAFPVAWPILRWRRNMVTLRNQLYEFSVTDTQCDCCSRNHVNQDGKSLECDREILETTICEWFGSIEEFDNAVQGDVEAELEKQLSVSPFGYWWVVNALLPVLWGQGFDKGAAIFRHGETLFAIAILLSGFTWHMLVAPFNFGTLHFLADQIEKLPLGWGFCSTALMLACQCGIYLGCHLLYFACHENLPTPMSAVVVFSAATFVLILPFCRCRK